MEWRREDTYAILGIGAAVAGAALIGSFAAVDAADQFAELEQPSWAPPSWVFGPVWTVLYVMIAIAGFLIWRGSGLRSRDFGYFVVQLAFNALWTPLFFAWGLRGLALAWILALDALVLAMIVMWWGRRRVVSYLLMPYLAWILFASALNAAVWWLNR